MRVVADTGPLLAAADRADAAHTLAAALVTALGRDLVVPAPVVTEVDQILRARISGVSARAFLGALVAGEHAVEPLTAGLLARAVAIDERFAHLGLGLADATVMALAERDGIPVLTFDFPDFRAAVPAGGTWQLVVDEVRYREAVR